MPWGSLFIEWGPRRAGKWRARKNKKWRRYIASLKPKGHVFRFCAGCGVTGWYKPHERRCVQCKKTSAPLRYTGRSAEHANRQLRRYYRETATHLVPTYMMPEGPCEWCGTLFGVLRIPCGTAYAEPVPTVYDHLLGREPESPNKDPSLCPEHAEEYIEYWTEMREEADRGRY